MKADWNVGRRAGLRTAVRRLLVAALLPLLLAGGVPVSVVRAQAPPPSLTPHPAPPAASFQGLSGRTLQAVEFHGSEALSEETLLYYLGLQIGQPLDEAQL